MNDGAPLVVCRGDDLQPTATLCGSSASVRRRHYALVWSDERTTCLQCLARMAAEVERHVHLDFWALTGSELDALAATKGIYREAGEADFSLRRRIVG